ncbi:Cysteine protease, papain family [Giardia duodenalis]|uniref:Cysteine protease, papain family n=1 Tax=Giardia intestinalis TaxID=5741 RepID=V6TF57_GIAIN|nr:Cysteine protease, papain family [Giardia intestinalis]
MLALLLFIVCCVSHDPSNMAFYIDPDKITFETIHENTKTLFSLFNSRFALDYPSDEAHNKALLSFAKNLAHHNATHARDMDHLDELLRYTDGYATYGLTSAFARDPTEPMKGFVQDTGVPEYDLSSFRDRIRSRLNLFKEAAAYQLKVIYSALVSAALPAPRSGCTTMYIRQNPLSPLPSIPLSADLREFEVIGKVRNQGVCGCCWAMASAVMLEGMTRSTQSYFKDKTEVDNTFKDVDLIVSEQYIMNNSRSSINNFCEGGNYRITSMDYANENIVKTVESEKNFPLESTHLEKNPSRIDVIANFKVSKAFLPYNTETVTGTNCKRSIIKLLDKMQTSSPMTNGAVNQIKSYLTRGIPVAAAMFTGADGPLSSRDFSNYKGGIFNKPCSKTGLDHQVMFAGYGYYQGVEVWVMRNSWGEQWGSYGHFYTPIGNNVLCSETYAYTDIPQYFPLNQVDKDKPYTERQKTKASTYWAKKLKRGDGVALDSDPSTIPPASPGNDNDIYVPRGKIISSPSSGTSSSSSSTTITGKFKLSIPSIIMIVTGILGSAGVAGIIAKFTCCRK